MNINGQFASQSGSTFLPLAKPPASMFSGFLHTSASLATLWQTKRPSRAPPFLRHRFPSVYQGSDSEDGSGGVPCPLHTRPALSHPSHSDWRDQSAGPLEIWLDQKAVHHCCPVENGPLPASGQLPSPHETTTVSSVPLLRKRWRDGTASSTLLPVARAGTYIHQLHQLYRHSTHMIYS